MTENQQKVLFNTVDNMSPIEKYYLNTRLIKEYEMEKAKEKADEVKEFDMGRIRKSRKVIEAEKEDLTFKVQLRVVLDRHQDVEKWDKVGLPSEMVKANWQALQKGEEIKNIFETKLGKLIVKTDAAFNDTGSRSYTFVTFNDETEDNCPMW